MTRHRHHRAKRRAFAAGRGRPRSDRAARPRDDPCGWTGESAACRSGEASWGWSCVGRAGIVPQIGTDSLARAGPVG